MPPGALVLSFDFELAWGLRQSAQPPPQAARYRGVVERVIPALLEILTRYELPATWATVAHLLLRPEDCPDGHYPYPSAIPPPNYAWFRGDWFGGIPAIDSAEAAAYHAPAAVQSILDCRVEQELAAHTFSHAPLGDPACSAEFARQELRLCQELAAGMGRRVTSLVFPRNEIGHLPVLRELGYRAFRGANAEWYWFGRANEIHRRRALRYGVWLLRFVDEFAALTPPLPPARRREGLWEIPHSMFFPGRRGVSRWITAGQRVRRAVRGMEAAAAQSRVFSLWTHPHNFLPHAERLLPAWESICRHAATLRDAGRLQVLTMSQLADLLDQGAGASYLAE